MTQPIGSIKTLIEIFGKEAFLEMIRKAPAPKNPKYKQLIAQTFAATKLNSGETTADKFIELTSDSDIEFFSEIRDSYREVQRIAELKKAEHSRRLWLARLRKTYPTATDVKKE